MRKPNFEKMNERRSYKKFIALIEGQEVGRFYTSCEAWDYLEGCGCDCFTDCGVIEAYD